MTDKYSQLRAAIKEAKFIERDGATLVSVPQLQWDDATHPETIRALLAERDALIHDNAEYVSAANELATENQRLREALATVKEWPITSPLNMDAHNMKVVAHVALAQEQGVKE